MSKRILSLILSVVMIASMTGCADYRMNIELEDDNTGSIKIQTAYNETLLDAPDAEDIDKMEQIRKEFSDCFKDMDGINVTTSPLSYEKNNSKYKGDSLKVSFADSDSFLNNIAKSSGNNPIRMIDLGKGKKRIEIDFGNSISQDEKDRLNESNLTPEEFKYLFKAFDGSVILSFETDYKVTGHNADKVEKGKYIWDMSDKIFTSADSKFTAFIEYEDKNPEPIAENEDKIKFVLNHSLNIDDPDFYGKALAKLGILKGTNNGLELDSTLTRVQGIAIYTRLLKLEDKITEFKQLYPSYQSGFTDVPGWAADTIDYLYYNGLVNGISYNKFGSDLPMSEIQFTALLLRALGYNEINGDFEYGQAIQKADDLGFYLSNVFKYEISDSNRLRRRDMSYMAFSGMFVPEKITGKTLYEILTQE